MKISFGVLVNDLGRLDQVLRRSEIQGQMHIIKKPDTATKYLNKLLETMENEGADVAVLTHQDMYYTAAWLPQVEKALSELPDSWITAGIIGKNVYGTIRGRFHDTRFPYGWDSGPLPCQATCFDECCIIVNLKKGFRFDEQLKGFDLYGTLAALQTEEMGGTAWIIDAFAQHHCLRPFTWHPDRKFRKRFKWLHKRFPHAFRIDSTVLTQTEEPKKQYIPSDMKEVTNNGIDWR